MSIKLSVEKDPYAIQTLRLRAFLRSFEDGFPAEYYEAVNGLGRMPDWSSLYPAKWKLALEEAQQLELGLPGVFENLSVALDRAREARAGRTILIGGPPCQAYSLAGRSRNAGIKDYVAESDARHFLYREYVAILDRLRPAAFVMENVKGMLSSRVSGGAIADKVFDDLRNAGDGYALLPLTAEGDLLGDRVPREFIVRAEEHGVPQARHRVIVVGLRSDLMRGRSFKGPLMMRSRPSAENSLICAIGAMPKLRSGLSRNDSDAEWTRTVKGWADRLAQDIALSPELRAEFRDLNGCRPKCTLTRTSNVKVSAVRPGPLALWLEDPKLEVLLDHETRGHIPADLGRYLFAAGFGRINGRSPSLAEFPSYLQPHHANRQTGAFADRFRVQLATAPSTTVTSHIAKDGHYFIHPDATQCRSLTVREAARLQTFPDNYLFYGPRTEKYKQVGNAVPALLARQIAYVVHDLIEGGS